MPVPSQEVITRDNAMVTVDGVAFFQVLNAARAAYEVHDVENAIINMTMTNIRTVMGSMELDSLLSQRDQINHSLLGVVDQPMSEKAEKGDIWPSAARTYHWPRSSGFARYGASPWT